MTTNYRHVVYSIKIRRLHGFMSDPDLTKLMSQKQSGYLHFVLAEILIFIYYVSTNEIYRKRFKIYF